MTRTPIFATLVLLFSLMAGVAHADDTSLTPVNINTADAMQLASLNGIGDAKAAAIVSYRKQNGPFQSADDLSNVKGIGPATVNNNADRIVLK